MRPQAILTGALVLGGLLLPVARAAEPPAHDLGYTRSETLLRDCRITTADAMSTMEQLRATRCLNYLRGSRDAYILVSILHPSARLFCFPDGASMGQLMRVVTAWLERHPEHHHRPGSLTIMQAWQEAFPCETP